MVRELASKQSKDYADGSLADTIEVRCLEVATTRIDNRADYKLFQQRIRQIVALDHPAIVPIQQAGLTKARQTAVILDDSEYMPLSDWWVAGAGEWPAAGPTAVAALRLMSTLVETLACLHKLGIVHHDLRLHHLFVTSQKQLGLAGFATFYPQTDGQQGEQASHLPEMPCAAPEWRLEGKLTLRSNVYSVGTILYELLAGQLPQHSISDWVLMDRPTASLAEVCSGLSAETVLLVDTCLTDQPNGRYRTMWVLQQAIHCALVAEEKLLKRQHNPGILDLLAIGRERFGRDLLLAFTLIVGLVVLALSTTEPAHLGAVEKIHTFVNFNLGLTPVILVVILLLLKELLYGFSQDVVVKRAELLLNRVLRPLLLVTAFIFILQLIQMISTLYR